MIPCKEIKCLKYPACRNKSKIQCTSLVDYAIDKSPAQTIIKTLSRNFPRLEQVETSPEDGQMITIKSKRRKYDTMP